MMARWTSAAAALGLLVLLWGVVSSESLIAPDAPDPVTEPAADEALAFFARAAREFPDAPDAHNNLGQMLARAGRHAEALPHLERAVALDADDPLFRRNLANAYEAYLDRYPHASHVAEVRARLAHLCGEARSTAGY